MIALFALPAAKATSSILSAPDILGYAFLIWASLTTVVTGNLTVSAMQNLIVLSLWFLVPVAIASDRFAQKLHRSDLDLAFVLLAYTSSLIFAVNQTPIALPEFLSPGNRTFGFFAVACLTWLAPLYWSERSRTVLIANLALFLLIAVSLSRVALVLAVGVLMLSRLRTRSIKSLTTTFALTSVAFVVLAGAVVRISVLKDRFFGGDRGFELFGVRFDAAGRSDLWDRTWNSFADSGPSIIVGMGAGASQRFVQSEFANISHPHNDYLRLLYDFGALGFGLWLISTGMLLTNAFLSLRHARSADTGEERVHLSALLGILSLLFGMLTDNVVIYVYVVVPIAVVVGYSRGQKALETASAMRLAARRASRAS